MDSHLMMIFGLLVGCICSCMAGVIPAVPVAPAAIAYSKAVPYDVPPHTSRIDISTKSLAAPIIAAPIVASAAAPFISGYPAAAVSAPIFSAPGFIQPTYGNLVAPFAPAYSPAIIG